MDLSIDNLGDALSGGDVGTVTTTMDASGGGSWSDGSGWLGSVLGPIAGGIGSAIPIVADRWATGEYVLSNPNYRPTQVAYGVPRYNQPVLGARSGALGGNSTILLIGLGLVLVLATRKGH